MWIVVFFVWFFGVFRVVNLVLEVRVVFGFVVFDVILEVLLGVGVDVYFDDIVVNCFMDFFVGRIGVVVEDKVYWFVVVVVRFFFDEFLRVG